MIQNDCGQVTVGVLAGGALLGFGRAIAGFCPGTELVAAGTGRKDAVFFILGGLVGFIYMYPRLADTMLFNSLLGGLSGGKLTLAQTEQYDALLGSIDGNCQPSSLA